MNVPGETLTTGASLWHYNAGIIYAADISTNITALVLWSSRLWCLSAGLLNRGAGPSWRCVVDGIVMPVGTRGRRTDRDSGHQR